MIRVFILKQFLSIICFLIFTFSFSQKTMEKEWDANAFKTIEVFADEAFKIEVIAAQTNKIKLVTKVEGETFENVLVDVLETNEILTLSTGKSPFFEEVNDKLAAHKVLSIEMKLLVPEEKNIIVSSELASFKGEGIFSNLTVNLERGSIKLLQFKGNATLLTRTANIEVEALANVSANAVSKKGNVENELPAHQKFHIEAESISGNIILKQTK